MNTELLKSLRQEEVDIVKSLIKKQPDKAKNETCYTEIRLSPLLAREELDISVPVELMGVDDELIMRSFYDADSLTYKRSLILWKRKGERILIARMEK